LSRVIRVSRTLKLRKFTLDDVVQLQALFSHPAILKPTFGRTRTYSRKDAMAYIKQKQAQYKRKIPIIIHGEADAVGYAIEHEGQLIGGIGFTLFGHKAEIGYWLGKQYWGQGIMVRVIKAFVLFLKKKYKIGRVEAKVFSFNLSSGRVLEKAGFKREALIVRDAKIGKKYYDHILFGKVV
jgi:ribosomal-protein-alanine N-acetyltransferase